MNPKRRLLTPILVYCEGLHEQVFIRRLHNLYKPPDSDFFFDIQKGAGGSPQSLVSKAAARPGGYQSRLVVCDSDRGEKEIEIAAAQASEHSIRLLLLRPCLEAVILAILEPGLKSAGWTTKQHKKRIHGRHIDRERRSDPKQYEFIDREMVEGSRSSNKDLGGLLELFEGGDK